MNGINYSPPDTGYYYGVVSSPNVGYNAIGTPAAFSAISGHFDLLSLTLSPVGNTDVITIHGYVGGVQGILKGVKTATLYSGHRKLVPFDSSFYGIDTVSIAFSSVKHFAVDNIVVIFN